jgi:quinoprotein glucose dehydrogenase
MGYSTTLLKEGRTRFCQLPPMPHERNRAAIRPLFSRSGIPERLDSGFLRVRDSQDAPLREALMRTRPRLIPVATLTALFLGGVAACASNQPQALEPQDQDWAVYGGSAHGDRFSPLTQINASNVSQLKPVWRIDGPAGGLQTTPLVIDGVLYGLTSIQEVFAADAATGRHIWTFNSGIRGAQPSRGLTYWAEGGERRLFAGVMNKLYALDPSTGRPVAGFGDNGAIDLRKDLGNAPEKNATYLTSPGVIYKDMIIVGFRTSEMKPAAPGWIRAYDVRTGKLRWTFKTIPHPGEPGHETWPADAWKTAGAANSWAGMVVDPARGMVFVPTGSPVDDMYGGDRHGDNLFSSSLLALDAATGKRVWHYQIVHHDIWDRDLASPPVLLTVTRNGRRVPAVAQATKQGFVFVFDRRTGEPLFPVKEQPFPASDVPGEKASPTQPIPQAPAPFARQRLTESELTDRTPAVQAWAKAAFRKLNGAGLFVPLKVDQQTIVFPGFDGGAEWGGPAVDPRSGVFYINSNDLAWTGGLMARGAPKAASAAPTPGADTYANQCAGCHGVDRAGAPPNFPSLIGLSDRMTNEQVAAIVQNGAGRMPGFPDIKGPALDALVAYARTGQEASAPGVDREAAPTAPPQARYLFSGYRKFLDPEGYPAVKPPWGTLNAIDLNTGKYLWRRPLGFYPELSSKGLRDTGSENYGGPVLTRSGLLFIGATIYDSKIRAFEAKSGKLLWEADLPYAGVATPATYMVKGRQYMVIATSNSRNPKARQGSAYVAFALP